VILSEKRQQRVDASASKNPAFPAGSILSELWLIVFLESSFLDASIVNGVVIVFLEVVNPQFGRASIAAKNVGVSGSAIPDCVRKGIVSGPIKFNPMFALLDPVESDPAGVLVIKAFYDKSIDDGFWPDIREGEDGMMGALGLVRGGG
jgi:hypothetical protein